MVEKKEEPKCEEPCFDDLTLAEEAQIERPEEEFVAAPPPIIQRVGADPEELDLIKNELGEL